MHVPIAQPESNSDIRLSMLKKLPKKIGFVRPADISHPAVGYVPRQTEPEGSSSNAYRQLAPARSH